MSGTGPTKPPGYFSWRLMLALIALLPLCLGWMVLAPGVSKEAHQIAAVLTGTILVALIIWFGFMARKLSKH